MRSSASFRALIAASLLAGYAGHVVADDIRQPAISTPAPTHVAVAPMTVSSVPGTDSLNLSATSHDGCGATDSCGEGCVTGNGCLCGNGCQTGHCCGKGCSGCLDAQSCCQKMKSLLHGPGNMYPHVISTASPKTYYYFRPYNHQHIRLQQFAAAQWGAEFGMPYSNAVFGKVYAEIENVGAAEVSDQRNYE